MVLEDTLAQVEGQIATGLISVYAALGGGWEIRFTGCTPSSALPADDGVLPPPRRLNNGEAPQPPFRGKNLECRWPSKDQPPSFCGGLLDRIPLVQASVAAK